MKQKSLKLSLLLLVFAILSSSMFGCNGSGKGNEDTHPESSSQTVDDKYEADNLPSDLDYDGREIKVLTWEETKADDWADTLNGETINDATYTSRSYVAERLDITFNISAQKGSWDYRNQFASNLEAYMLSGINFDIVGQYTPAAALTATKGLLEDISKLKYINFDKPWWPGDMLDSCRVGNSMYFCSGDITPTCINAIGSVFVNLNLMEEYGIEENIYEVVKSGNWTLETLKNMFIGVVGSSSTSEMGVYALSMMHRGVYDNLFYGGGLTFVSHDDENYLTLNEDIMGEKMDNWYQACHDLLWDNPDVLCLEYQSGLTPEHFTKDDLTIENTFMNEKSILHMSTELLDAKKYLRNAEFNFAVIPYPKYDSNQKDYYTITNYWVTMYGVPTSATDADVSAAVLEAMGSSAYRSMTPKIYEDSFQYRFLQNPENAEMLDLIHDTMVYDTGRLFSDDIAIFSTFRNAFYNTKSWTTLYGEKIDIWLSGIDSVNSKLS